MFNAIKITVTRAMAYKGQLPARNHVFYIAKLSNHGKKADVRYSINKEYETEVGVEGVKAAIIAKLQEEITNIELPA